MDKITNRFYLKLAGYLIHVSANYPYVARMCESYFAAEEESQVYAPIEIVITEEDITNERERFGQDAFPAYLESLALYRKIVETLIEKDVLLIHGSAIAIDEEAYLFIAPSGTGKSTHMRLWREQFGNRAVMVNDDKPLVKMEDGKVIIYGTPWNGKHHLGANIAVPLKGICYLERGEENQIERLNHLDAYPLLLRQTYRTEDPEKMVLTLELLEKILDTVSIYKMQMNNYRDDAVKVSYHGMHDSES